MKMIDAENDGTYKSKIRQSSVDNTPGYIIQYKEWSSFQCVLLLPVPWEHNPVDIPPVNDCLLVQLFEKM